jgi:hypothetical protein
MSYKCCERIAKPIDKRNPDAKYARAENFDRSSYLVPGLCPGTPERLEALPQHNLLLKSFQTTVVSRQSLESIAPLKGRALERGKQSKGRGSSPPFGFLSEFPSIF